MVSNAPPKKPYIDIMNNTLTKWHWMMNYCKNNNLPPAQSWAWQKAEKAYEQRT